jgi:PKD repeat protein
VFGGFNASGLSAAQSGGGTPPDTTGATGPTQYIEIVNSEIAIYDRTNLSMIGSPVDLATFTGGIVPCDVQIKFDPQSGRWFYLALRCDGTTTSNQLYFGWSKTANPSDLTTASWCSFAVSSTPATSLDDYPKLGLDAGHLIIGSNLFDASSGAFQSAHVLVAPKPPGGTISGCGSAPTFTVFGSSSSPLMTSAGNQAFTPEPATVSDGASATGYIVAADFNDPNGTSGSNLMLWQIGGSTSRPALLADGDVSVSSFTVPPPVPQPGTSDTLDSLDGRLTQAVEAADPNDGGVEAIWTQHTVANAMDTGSVVRWYEVIPSTKTLRQHGEIGDSAGFAFNGAITPTLNGGAVAHYDTGGSSQDVEIKAQARSAADTLNTMTALSGTLATSSAVDSDFSCPSQPYGSSQGATSCRWGDYAGASADPNCPDAGWGSNQINGPAGASVPSFGNEPQWQTDNFALTASTSPLLACFTTTPNPVAVNSSVSFDPSDSVDSGATISSYSWDFGRGTGTSTAQQPTHAYTAPGLYPVTLTVSDGTHTATATEQVTVIGPPTASFTMPQPAIAEAPTTFDASNSTDAGTTLNYSWTFSDGGTPTGVSPSHTFASAGTYSVTLTVSNGLGESSSPDTQQVTVVGPIAASFSASPDPTPVGSSVAFDASGSTDPGATVTGYSWNFGDGTTGSGRTASHAYTAAGTYTATLTVTDGFGQSSSTTHTITVVGPPSASFTAGPNPAVAGSAVAFDAAGSTDPGTTIASYSWNFGDGGTGTGAATTHTFVAAGTYTVTLTVADNFGRMSTTTHTVSVVGPPTASFTTAPSPAIAGAPVGFNASGSTDPGATITAYSWNFGDGRTGSGINPRHSYSAPGPYTVTLTVTDGYHETASTTHPLTVKPRLHGSLAIPKKQRLATVLKRGLVVSVSVNESAKGVFVITTAVRTKKNRKSTTLMLLRDGSRTVSAGSRPITLKLPASAIRKLRGQQTALVAVRVTLTDAQRQTLTLSAGAGLTR